MYLTRHQTPHGPTWAMDGTFLPPRFDLCFLLNLPSASIAQVAGALPSGQAVGDAPLLAPIEASQEVWASGVTYLRSREARKAESEVGDVYEKVYDATRPELFFKAPGWRVRGQAQDVNIRADSRWNVPEPELTLVVNSRLEIVGYTAGNDMSSRDIEGENPLYLPQAKVYDGSCALGSGIVLCGADALRDMRIGIQIRRAGLVAFEGSVSTAQIKRPLEELVAYLGREMEFPNGVFLMTGTGIVPPDHFTLEAGDAVDITIGEVRLSNPVTAARGRL
jgi:2-dehydro-3-deoxy-D-arabinonate dehydratase